MRTLRILIVEDDSIIGGLLAEMLTDLGHSIYAIELSENAAVAAAIRNRPDLILIDIGLGGGSGFAAMDRILATGPIAHIFMSGGRIAQYPVGAIILQKPFSERDLVAAIRQATG